MSLKLPTTMRSRIFFSAPVADEFRKLCKIAQLEPDVLLTKMIDAFTDASAEAFAKKHFDQQRRAAAKSPPRRPARKRG